MKKTIYLLTILLTSLILASCNKNSSNNSEPTEPTLDPANSCVLKVEAYWLVTASLCYINNRKCIIEITYSNGKPFKKITDLTKTQIAEYTIPKGSTVKVTLSGTGEECSSDLSIPCSYYPFNEERTYMIGNLDKRTLIFYIYEWGEVRINMTDK